MRTNAKKDTQTRAILQLSQELKITKEEAEKHFFALSQKKRRKLLESVTQ